MRKHYNFYSAFFVLKYLIICELCNITFWFCNFFCFKLFNFV